MYKRLSCTLLIATLLGGCQQTIPEMLRPLDCSLNSTQLSDLVQLESRYAEASSNIRRVMRKQAVRDKDNLQAALLFSGADAGQQMLKQSLSYYRKITFEPAGCDSEHYIALREGQTRARLNLYQHEAPAAPSDDQSQQAELEKLQEENRQLQAQIDALTGLESELSGQRGLPR